MTPRSRTSTRFAAARGGLLRHTTETARRSNEILLAGEPSIGVIYRGASTISRSRRRCRVGLYMVDDRFRGRTEPGKACGAEWMSTRRTAGELATILVVYIDRFHPSRRTRSCRSMSCPPGGGLRCARSAMAVERRSRSAVPIIPDPEAWPAPWPQPVLPFAISVSRQSRMSTLPPFRRGRSAAEYVDGWQPLGKQLGRERREP